MRAGAGEPGVEAAKVRMFDRFIRLAKARKALRDGRYEDALQLAQDPVVADDRRAEEVRGAACGQLVARARQRLAQGDIEAAAALLRRIEAAAGGADHAELTAAIEAERERRRLHRTGAAADIAAIREFLAAGELAAARARLAAARPQLAPSEEARLLADLREAAERAALELEACLAQLATGDVEAAAAHWRRARGLDVDAPRLTEVAGRLAPKFRERRVEAAAAALRGADLAQALSLCRSAGDGGLLDARETARMLAELQPRLLSMLDVQDLVLATQRARLLDAAGAAVAEPMQRLVAALVRAGAVQTRTEAAEAFAAVLRQAEPLGLSTLVGAAREAATAAERHAEQIQAARAAVATGDLEHAAEILGALLAEQPFVAEARRELSLVEEGIAAQEQRLQQARAAARGNRLAEAAALAAGLAGPTRTGAAAQRLLAEVQARQAVVDRGLDEVKVALHGRTAASIEGVRHCLRRLEELERVQADHPELQRVREAVAVEIAALELARRCAEDLGRGDIAAVCTAFQEWLQRRPSLLTPDRLDARFAELADLVGRQAETHIARGQLGPAGQIAELLDSLAHIDGAYPIRAAQLRVALGASAAAGRELVERAREQLQRGELAEAERLCEEASVRCGDASEVRRLRAELAEMGRQQALLARVDDLARERDYHGAQQKLAELPPTPAMLRTRIYDMKQSLARAQGLEGAFLLRVDEGGECLVMRGESVSIGNVRQSRADLPVLANLAGRHASVRRSMSFHGGMQDVLVAEEGEARVGGEPVTTRRLASGDRIQLGSALGLLYSVPTSRSLSTCLQLQGGFQVAGTDRILLMKDRGKDGRLLLGPGRDVHVRVPRARTEVEVFASNTGQIRVACAEGGTIDGAPFRGEHPVAAGQIVEAGGISFVLLPWRAQV